MQRTTLLVMAATVILIAGGVFFMLRRGSVLPAAEAKLSKPWIEVIRPGAAQITADEKGIVRKLATGDELEPGTAVATDHTGLANVYFPDGSVARLDVSTRLVVAAGSYDVQTERLSVRLNLLRGRVWSKVVSLATPDSLWQVETTNAVATVRGTAFGVEYVQDGKSSIIGAEDEVRVAPIDPKTKTVIAAAEVTITPDKFLEVRSEDLPAVAASPENFAAAVQDVPEAVAAAEWVRRAKEADEELDDKIEGLRRRERDESEVRRELREDLAAEFIGVIEERRQLAPLVEPVEPTVIQELDLSRPLDFTTLPDDPAEKAPEALPAPTPVLTPIIAPPSSGATRETNTLPPSPDKLFVEPANPGRAAEGAEIAFRAILVGADGRRRDMTAEVTWRAVGPIGRFIKPGVFLAALDPTVAEFGSGAGAVAATWADPAGTELTGATGIFNIDAKPEPILEPRG